MDQPESLERLISTPRFSTYVQECSGDQDRAVDLYHWTGQIGGALLVDFRHLEILFRNRIDAAITAHVESVTQRTAGYWFDDKSWINPNGHWWDANAARAIRTAKEHARPSKSQGAIISELTFGFWRYIIHGRYEESFWIPILDQAFTQVPGKAPGDRRQHLEEYLKDLNRLRNRLAHHEPIWKPWERKGPGGTKVAYSLSEHHQRLIEVLSWIDPTAGSWIQDQSRVPELLEARP